MEYAGLVALRHGAYERSEDFLQQALQIRLSVHGKDSPRTAEIYYDLASLYLENGSLEKAIRRAKKVWEINSQALGNDHPEALAALLPLGRALEMMDEDQDALKQYLMVYQSYKKHYGMDDVRCLNIAGMVAPVLMRLDRREEAIAVFKETIGLLEERHPEEDRLLCISKVKLAAAELSAGAPESIQRLTMALEQLQRKYPEVYAYMRTENVQLMQVLLNRGSVDTAFQLADVFNRQLRDSIRGEFWGMTAVEQQEYVAFADGYSFYQSISLAVDYQEHPLAMQLGAEWLINGKGLVQEAQAVQSGAVEDLRRRQAWTSQSWIAWKTIQANLADDEVFIDILGYLDFEFATGEPVEHENRYVAWLLRPGAAPRLIELGSADAMDAAIVELQQACFAAPKQILKVGEREAYAAFQPKLRAVSKLLWEPLRNELGDAKSIIISPDQATWLVPWAALLNDDLSYAIESHRIGLALSGRELLSSAAEALPDQAVIFADPAFNAVTEERVRSPALVRGVQFDQPLRLPPVPQLAWSALEAKAIKPSLKVLTGKEPRMMVEQDALESSFKSLHGPEVLVLSTHGFFSSPASNLGDDQSRGLSTTESGDGDPLLRCGLLLAGANQSKTIERLENDGVLTGAEIAATDLKGTRLAVLSACETGLGQLEATGGVVGLRRAFHIAGARSVVSTLWQIPDQETALIMNDLFQALTRQPDITWGLQTAQQAAIARGRRQKGIAHPFYWAAFSLTGQSGY